MVMYVWKPRDLTRAFFFRRIFLGGIEMLFLIAVTHAATYYIDATAGDDGKNGTSELTAWKTLDKVNGAGFIAGDSILFKAGGSWLGQLNPKGSGSHLSPIVIGKYGPGAYPQIAANGVKASAVYLLNQQYYEIKGHRNF